MADFIERSASDEEQNVAAVQEPGFQEKELVDHSKEENPMNQNVQPRECEARVYDPPAKLSDLSLPSKEYCFVTEDLLVRVSASSTRKLFDAAEEHGIDTSNLLIEKTRCQKSAAVPLGGVTLND